MAVPIIFVHTGDHFYLNFSLSQAHHANPQSKIFLITDTLSNRYPFVTYVPLKDFAGSTTAIDNAYRHMSTNSFEGELFCFRRWFIIRDFCRKNNLDDFLYLDSDVLIFNDAAELFREKKQFHFTISKSLGPQCCYFYALRYLENFCGYMLRLYNDPQLKNRFEEKHQHHLQNNLPGGVCDMTAFFEYAKDHPGAANELAVIKNGAVFDDNINQADGFEFDAELKIKKLTLRLGIPYGKWLETEEMIRFETLHFQGAGKKYIDRFYSHADLDPLKKKLEKDRRIRDNWFLARLLPRLGYQYA